ncbi:MAG TPA: AraC family transcriptional regulator [Candidatus Eisenbergiella merdipullorum]|uniref:AraC family transcriptional regulator n=1 Tax=Candidatus Eisenbergiella merdipullorum TaxID=2838553 RepID=A0A9D2I7S9_9FIRM|nr:AraC family transcriptional regulator [Candidatus Eisenbergiella merdipullorum]
MLDAYKELTPVIYGENAVKHLYSERRTPGELCFAMHWHDRMELLYVLRGSLELHGQEGKYTVHAGQTAVSAPRQMHGGFAGPDGVAYHTFMFDVEKFCNATFAAQKYLLPVCENKVGFQRVIDDDSMRMAEERLIASLEDRERNPLSDIGIIYELLGILYGFREENMHVLLRQNQAFSEILKYVNERFARKLSPKEVSARFGYNETYFCRRFKKITGLTFTGYLLALRMESAQKLLTETREDISIIAWKCGYADVSYFSHCFKRQFGMSPMRFRKEKNPAFLQ